MAEYAHADRESASFPSASGATVCSKSRNPKRETTPTKGREHAKAFGVSKVQIEKLETDPV
jgi:hypothetical protein